MVFSDEKRAELQSIAEGSRVYDKNFHDYANVTVKAADTAITRKLKVLGTVKTKKIEGIVTRGWDAGLYALYEIEGKNLDTMNLALTVHVRGGASPTASGNVTVDATYGGTIATRHGRTFWDAAEFLVRDAVEHLKPTLGNGRKKIKQEAHAIGEEVDATYAKQHAVTTPEAYLRIFDKLKPKQRIWLHVWDPIHGKIDYKLFIVGRRSYSKKYNVSSIQLWLPGQSTKKDRFGRSPLRTTLYKRELSSGEGDYVSAAHGDMALRILGMYREH